MSYSTLYQLCQYDSSRVITTDRHFLPPNDSVYSVGGRSTRMAGPRRNMPPGKWGPHAWDFLESVARGYSDSPSLEQRLAMRQFLEKLNFALPCEKCRNNFASEVRALSERDLDSRKSLLTWLMTLRGSIRHKKELSEARKATKGCKTCKR